MTGREFYVIDDNSNVLDLVDAYLGDEGHKVFTYETAKDFLDEFRPKRPDDVFVLSDLNLKHSTGIEIYSVLDEKYNHQIPFLLMTGQGYEGPIPVIFKPFSKENFMHKIDEVIELYESETQPDKSTYMNV